MHKILSRNIIIYLLSHPMSEMINLINLKSMIWKTYINKYYQVVQTSQTNQWNDMSTKLITQLNVL